ncbi:MAG: hypothetical protein LBC77_04670 [Spirochaetaceae bacterium]|jgi:hypothetical protein|nr:hypothetical protein [Spirochaetaceae bacterium]
MYKNIVISFFIVGSVIGAAACELDAFDIEKAKRTINEAKRVLEQERSAWEAQKIGKYNFIQKLNFAHSGMGPGIFVNITVSPDSEPVIKPVDLDWSEIWGDEWVRRRIFRDTISGVYEELDAILQADKAEAERGNIKEASIYITYDEQYHYPIHIHYLVDRPDGRNFYLRITDFKIAD